jgi:hypothetical protein
MPMDAIHRTYVYNGNAHVLSGKFHRPIEHLIEVQGASSLPTTGGHGNSRVDKFRVEEFARFTTGYSHVSGSRNEADGSHTTLVTAAIEDLNILDIVTADRVVARLASHHPSNEDEPRITLLGSRFENLRIAGCAVEVELNFELFRRLETFKDVRKEYETSAEFRTMTENPFHTGQPQKSPEANGAVICSLVKDMKIACPGIRRHGHAFAVPQFGKIFVAELVAEHSKRTLTMLRLELGSPVGGNVTAAQVQGNGRPIPPP